MLITVTLALRIQVFRLAVVLQWSSLFPGGFTYNQPREWRKHIFSLLIFTTENLKLLSPKISTQHIQHLSPSTPNTWMSIMKHLFFVGLHFSDFHSLTDPRPGHVHLNPPNLSPLQCNLYLHVPPRNHPLAIFQILQILDVPSQQRLSQLNQIWACLTINGDNVHTRIMSTVSKVSLLTYNVQFLIDSGWKNTLKVEWRMRWRGKGANVVYSQDGFQYFYK